ncbi:hypothetical protein HMPREF1548_00078 [Clostridium sp. KLE 1755]|nr:hypothetical protein HMPREF1548_00078 [Clostridium sp. KLE 1755]
MPFVLYFIICLQIKQYKFNIRIISKILLCYQYFHNKSAIMAD